MEKGEKKYWLWKQGSLVLDNHLKHRKTKHFPVHMGLQDAVGKGKWKEMQGLPPKPCEHRWEKESEVAAGQSVDLSRANSSRIW